MTEIKTLETFQSEFGEIELCYKPGIVPKAYDGEGTPPTCVVCIRRAGKTVEAFNVQELLDAFHAVDWDLKAYAEAEPAVLAAAVGYLDDRGRVVQNHPLYADLLPEMVGNFAAFLPRFEESQLIWNIIIVEQSGLAVQERRILIES